MMKISKNFDRKEFACRCGCGYDTVDAELLRVLQWLRDETRMPVRIKKDGGCRCSVHNIIVGGTPLSQHILGKAADITVEGISPHAVARYLIENLDSDRYGIGIYPGFVHIDVRDDGRRWTEADEGRPIERPGIGNPPI